MPIDLIVQALHVRGRNFGQVVCLNDAGSLVVVVGQRPGCILLQAMQQGIGAVVAQYIMQLDSTICVQCGGGAAVIKLGIEGKLHGGLLLLCLAA